MIAVDTNLLVYAHRAGAPEHRAARDLLERAANDARGWGIAAACVCEFYSVVTHPSAAGGPSTPALAREFLSALVESGNMTVWLPGPGFTDRLLQLAVDLDVSGVRVFDLQIALTAFDNGATELWTNDRNFRRIPGLRVESPLRSGNS